MNSQIYEYGRSFYFPQFLSSVFYNIFIVEAFYPCLGLFQNYFCFAFFTCFLYYYCDTTKKIWKKGFILLTVHHERKSAQELRPWRNAAFVPVQAGFLSHLVPLAEGWHSPNWVGPSHISY